MREPTPAVLVATRNPSIAATATQALETHCEVFPASTALEAERLMRVERPDLVLLDARLPDADYRDLCAQFRADEATRDVPIIVVLAADTEQAMSEALAAGAVDCVTAPMHRAVLASRVLTHMMLKSHRDAMGASQIRDGLTGLPNALRAEQVLDEEWRRNARDRRSLGVLVIEVDGIDELNREYGRVVGDESLQRIGRCLARTFHRSGDLVARVGGARFLGILPRVDDAGAEAVAERARRAVSDLTIPNRQVPGAIVTVSIGVAAQLPAIAGRVDGLIDLARRRLGEAQAHGGNRWVGVATGLHGGSQVRGALASISGAEEGGLSGSILVVDDTPTNIELLSALLADTGCEVRVALSGEDALAAVAEQVPDLVLLDISMPILDGYEVCRRLKADGATAHLPVIFISAHDEPMDKVRAFEVGGADFVQKPFQPGEVLARIAHQLKITRLQGEMSAANQRLMELDRLKATITAMLVHDLRSPLTVVRMAISALNDGSYELSGEELGEMTGAASAGVAKVLRLVDDMLEVYRSEAGNSAFPLDRLDPEPVLARAVAFARMEGRERKLEVVAEVDSPLPPILGNSDRLDRALTNLLSNAIKFTPAGGRIRLHAHRGSNDCGEPVLRIEISDTGAGIPAGELATIFEPYRQVVSPQQKLGVGLGLAIVQRIVEGHHGTITVTSELGAGTQFTIDVPAIS